MIKAAVVESPGVVRVRELPEPVAGDYQAHCTLLFGSVCAGTDSHLVAGDPPFCYWLKPPFILGHESVGRVTAVGAKVRHLKPGDLITRVGCPATGGVGSGWGGFAEVGIATDWRAMQEDGVSGWEDLTVQQVLPAEVDPAEATLFITWRETYSYLTRMGMAAGKNLLIIGSGGNGLAFASHARNLGAGRITLIGSDERREDAARAGAHQALNYRDNACWDQAREGCPEGYDRVIDVIGKAGLAQQGLGLLKPGGTLGIYGLDDVGKLTINPMQAPGTFTFYKGGYAEAEAHDAVLQAYLAGQLDASVWLQRDQVFTLDTIGDALQAVKNRTLIKPLIKLS